MLGGAMNIYFVESETSEQEFFAEALREHTVSFVQKPEEVGENADIVSVFIYARIDPAFLDAHPQLKLVATRSTGFDHIDIEACAARGVTVSRVASYGDNTVAEHA